MDEKKIKELEERLARLERKCEEYDAHMKSDLKHVLGERETLEKLKEKVNFIDKKIESR